MPIPESTRRRHVSNVVLIGLLVVAILALLAVQFRWFGIKPGWVGVIGLAALAEAAILTPLRLIPDGPRPTWRWYHLTPDRLIIGLIMVVSALWLADRFWLAGNHLKGWGALTALVIVGFTGICVLQWFSVSLLFRLRFQFGIRPLLIFGVACSIAGSWLAAAKFHAARQAEALAWMHAKSGFTVAYPDYCTVTYDWQLDSNGATCRYEPPQPAWLREMFGVDFFSVVVELHRRSAVVVDSQLENRFNEFRRLRKLTLAGTGITDAWLEHIEGLTELNYLDLSDARITDAGLQHLEGLTQLQFLVLNGTEITDAGLVNLVGLTKLTELHVLTHTQVTRAGIRMLQYALPTCRIRY